MAGSGSSGRVLPWSGEKQMTRLVPRAGSWVNSASAGALLSGTSCCSAAKSLVKTKVPV